MHSHAGAWERETPATSISISLTLLIPPPALLRATPLPRHLPLKGGEICLSLFPCSRVGTGMVSVMYAFPRRSVGTRNSCNINKHQPDPVDPPSGAAAGYALAAPSPPQGGERFASPCSHAPAWEQETVSVMYAFPRRSVGTRSVLGGGITGHLEAFPRRSVGTRRGIWLCAYHPHPLPSGERGFIWPAMAPDNLVTSIPKTPA